MLVVFTTAPTAEEAESLAARIIEQRLAACVQVLPNMTSHYVWSGSVQKESEHLLLVKTLEGKLEELEQFIRANHSYEVPEFVAVKAEYVSAEYLGWMKDLIT